AGDRGGDGGIGLLHLDAVAGVPGRVVVAVRVAFAAVAQHADNGATLPGLVHRARRVQHTHEVGAGRAAHAAPEHRADMAPGRPAPRVGYLEHGVAAPGDEARLDHRPADALDARAGAGGRQRRPGGAALVPVVVEEHRVLRVHAQHAGAVATVAHVA